MLYCFFVINFKSLCKKLFLATTRCANCFLSLYFSQSCRHFVEKCTSRLSTWFASTVLKRHGSKEIWKKLSKMWKNRFRLPLPMGSSTTSKARRLDKIWNMQYLHISKPNRNIQWVEWRSQTRSSGKGKPLKSSLLGNADNPYLDRAGCFSSVWTRNLLMSTWDQLQPARNLQQGLFDTLGIPSR